MAKKHRVLAQSEYELRMLEKYLISTYPKDEQWIEDLIENRSAPIVIYVYEDPEEGFGNRIEFDILDNLDEDEECLPVPAFLDPEEHPEYFL